MPNHSSAFTNAWLSPNSKVTKVYLQMCGVFNLKICVLLDRHHQAVNKAFITTLVGNVDRLNRIVTMR